MFKKILIFGVVAAIALFVLAQLVPFGHDHTNPPVVQEPAWDSPETRALAVRACFDCHSNETAWPWYTRVAPSSWLVAWDVAEGRSRLNFSEWGNRRRDVEDIPRVVQNGSMPPGKYLLMHKVANLTPAEREQLVNGLVKTLGLPGVPAPRPGRRGGGGDD